MGCVGCCLRENTLEEQEDQNRICLPLYRLGQLYFDLCHSLFQSRDQGVVPLDDPATLPGVPSSPVNTGDNNTAILLSNNDPRGSQPQRQHHDLVLRQAETPTHKPTSVSVRYEKVANIQADPKEKNGSTNTCHSGSLQPSPRMTAGVTCLYPSSDDEDACPICLEEYTSENPRSTLQCSHQFHLCCVYEWMERSHACPFCNKLMLFKEDV
ncbi:E3 ubiquitin-protein ligase At3g02290-like [Curcuma longa]|uniref:E3 ubiquitin-protein ligase At3g02290-like n=1 Tax=Curcuma longa TaxID=136217 RepID=UPI003D9F34A2